jgi:Flp pilus assembly protein TadD
MIIVMGLAVWRAVLLIALGLAPWGAPLEAPQAVAATTGGALLHLAIGVIAIGAAAFYVRAVRAREPWAAPAGLALIAAAAVLSAMHAGDRGPLARGVWVVSPFAWGFVAVLAADFVARSRGLGAERAALRMRFVAVGLAVSAVSLFAARGRLAPRDHVWAEILATDPGNAPAAIAVAGARRAAGDRAEAVRVVRVCADASPASCACGERAAIDAIDDGDYAGARALLERGESCAATLVRDGISAEAHVGTGDVDGGVALAEGVLQKEGDEPHALYARGWAQWLRGDAAGARTWVARAVERGRGVPADVLLGTILFQQGDLDGAQRAFKDALSLDPKDARATYDLALIAHQRGQYHDAREGYLQALKLDPKYLEARYNLVVLTHAHGADAEAQHHFVEFALAAPNDPRVAQLRATLATPVR